MREHVTSIIQTRTKADTPPSPSNLPRGGLLDLLREVMAACFAAEEHGHTFDQATHGALCVYEKGEECERMTAEWTCILRPLSSAFTHSLFQNVLSRSTHPSLPSFPLASFPFCTHTCCKDVALSGYLTAMSCNSPQVPLPNVSLSSGQLA